MNEIQTNEPDANQLFRWRFTECFGTLTPEEVLAASKAAADEIGRLRARNADLRRIIGEWWADPDNPPLDAAKIALDVTNRR